MDWTPDEKALNAKRAELIADVAAILDPVDAHLAGLIVEAFCQMTPPLEPPRMIHMITAQSGGLGGGETTKPGNLRLNWHKLVRSCGDMVLTAAGVAAHPVLIPFAALSLWNKYWTHATIPLSREQATALFAMWSRKDSKNRITRDVAIAAVNDLLAVFKLPLIDQKQFDVIERDLTHLRCIECDQDGIWLREWVKTTYE